MDYFEFVSELLRSKLCVILEKKRIEEMSRHDNYADEEEHDKEREPKGKRDYC